MKRYALCLLIVILLVAGCNQRPEEGPEALSGEGTQPEATSTIGTEPPTDERAVVSPSRVVLAEGELVAAVPALSLSFETSGRLVSLNVEPGDRVESGEVIATLADGTLEDGVTSAELQVAQAETTLVLAELSLENLLTWEPDAAAVAAAEADLAAAQGALDDAQGADAVARLQRRLLPAFDLPVAVAEREPEGPHAVMRLHPPEQTRGGKACGKRVEEVPRHVARTCRYRDKGS